MHRCYICEYRFVSTLRSQVILLFCFVLQQVSFVFFHSICWAEPNLGILQLKPCIYIVCSVRSVLLCPGLSQFTLTFQGWPVWGRWVCVQCSGRTQNNDYREMEQVTELPTMWPRRRPSSRHGAEGGWSYFLPLSVTMDNLCFIPTWMKMLVT